MAVFFNVCARFFRLKSVGTDGFRFLFIYLHNIGCGSAVPKSEKLRSSVLSLHSPFTIFVEDRIRLGSAKIGKTEFLRFVVALAFRYLCII